MRTALEFVRQRWDILAVIAAGGALGSAARWGLTIAVPHRVGHLPWATLLANLSGALLLGVLMVFVLEVWPTTRLVRPFVGVGILGGYTTFSTWMLESQTLIATGHVLVAVAYAMATVVAGLLAVWLGLIAGRGFVAGVAARGGRR